MVKFLVMYLKMYMKSHLGLMLEQSWDLYMYPLMVLMMEIFRQGWVIITGRLLREIEE